MGSGDHGEGATRRHGDTPPLDESPRAAILVAHDTEEGRALLQERIRLFARVVMYVGLGFDTLANGLALASGRPISELAMLPGNIAHFVLLMVLATIAISFRHVKVPSNALPWVDGATSLVIGALQSVMGVYSPQAAHPALQGPHVTAASAMPLVAATLSVVVLRGIIVPSSARRTLIVSVVSCMPVLVAAHVIHVRYHVGGLGETTAQQTFGAAIWLICTVALATTASAVIYTLQARVRDAMQLGQYTLEEKLGEGGMGVVYRARHALLRRPTAVKLLRPDRTGEGSLARFERRCG